MADQAWTPPASDAVWTPPDSDAVSDAPETDPKPLTVGGAIKGAGDVALTGALNIVPSAINSGIDLVSRATGFGPAKDVVPEAQLSDSGRNLMQNVLKPRTANGLDVSDEELRAVLDPSGTVPIERLRAAYKLEGAKSTAQLLKDSGTTTGDVVGNAIDVGGDVGNIIPAAGLAKSAASGALRTAARGAGTDAAAAMQARIDDATAAGTQLTAGQAGGSRTVQALENTSGRLWGGGKIAENAATQTTQLETTVNNIVDNLNPKGAALTPTGAGAAISKGVADTKQSMKSAEDAAYAKVDQLVPESTPMNVSASAQKAAELAKPTSNEALNAATVSPKIKAVSEALAAYPDGTMPYADLTRLRTHVGSMIDRSFAPSDPATNGAMKQLYGSLSDDLNNGAGAVSPEAQDAVKSASNLYKTNQAQRKELDRVVNRAGGPEAVFQAATGQTKDGATKIAAVLSALDPENANVVRATVLHRMGQAVPSATNPGNSFNANTLLTNWSKMSSEAKDSLFGSSGAGNDLRKSLDSITNTIGTMRDAGHTLANPSGSAGAVSHSLGLWGLLTEAGGAVTTGAVTGHLGAGIATAAGSVGAAATAAGLNSLLARALVNPRTARWLAKTTKLPTSAARTAAVAQLAQMGKVTNDQDAKDLAAALQGGTQ